jgi:hypothetical protein
MCDIYVYVYIYALLKRPQHETHALIEAAASHVVASMYAPLKRPPHETHALIEAAEYVKRDLESANRDYNMPKET